jgi:hypothetical protein
MLKYRAHSGTCDQILLSIRSLFSESCCPVSVGCPIWREVESVICYSQSVVIYQYLHQAFTLHVFYSSAIHIYTKLHSVPWQRLESLKTPWDSVVLGRVTRNNGKVTGVPSGDWRVLKLKLLYDWRSVSQSVSMSSCRAPFWGRSQSRSYFTTGSQSVSMSWYRVPMWDLRPDIISCRNVAVWNLRSCIFGAPSLTRGQVCNLQCNHSMVRVAQNPKPYFTVSFETPSTWRSEVTLWLTVSRSVCLGVEPTLGLATRY